MGIEPPTTPQGSPAHPAPHGIPPIPALDGLRGLALAGVLAFHANGALAGGFLGVDLFFVLSGYLITSLLLAEHAARGRIDLGAFWIRRARRLLPAVLALMPAIAAYAWFIAAPQDVAKIRGDALATLFYFANWRAIYAGGSYWDLFTTPSPLEHTWSLSIEEQFYVAWPLFVFLALRRFGWRTLLVATLSLLALSIGLSLGLFDLENTSRVYFGTDTRATALLAGAILAMLLRPGASFSVGATRLADGVGVLALGLLAYAWVTLEGTDAWLYRGGFWATELAALALIVCAVAGQKSVVARLLAFEPLRLLGAISYGAYLWHWPINIVLTTQRTELRGLRLELLRVALTFAVSAISYRYLEQPIRRRGLPWRRWYFASPAFVAGVVLIVLVGTRARPIPLTLQTLPPMPQPGAVIRLRVTMLGDSTANSLGWSLRGVRDPGVDVELEAHDGASLLREELPAWPHAESEATVVMLGGAFLYGIHVKGKWTKACHAEWNGRFERNLEGWLANAAPANGRVWVATIPYPLGRYDDASYRKEVDCINDSIRKVVAKLPRVELLDVFGLLCEGETCRRASNGKEIRPDGVHYDMKGARSLAADVLRRLESPKR